MTRTWTGPLMAALLLMAPRAASAQNYDDIATPRAASQLTILQINDVYSTVPVDGQGGLARVATIKKQIAASGRTPLLMIGGDFLSSSVASTVFKGEQMVDALNAAGLDVATFGNHEFDFGLDTLLDRMRQARWQWVIANLLDRRTGRLVGDAPPYVVRTVGSLRVGILGLCLTADSMNTPTIREAIETIDPLDAAARYIPEMKREGVDAIIALTHLPYATDRLLAERFPEIDVIVGGHEHFPITAFAGRTLISKAGSEARYVARIDLHKRDAAPLARYFELIPVTASIKDDPAAADVINAWEARLGAEMDDVLGATRVPLDAQEIRLRASETNLGNFFADVARRQVQADVGLMNAGGIRGSRIYPAGEITRRTLVQMHPFSNKICKIEVTGDLLRQALEHGVSRLPLVAGHFPQVSGVTFRVAVSEPVGSRVKDVRVGGQPLELTRTYTVALPDYVMRGGDGYAMFEGSPVLVDADAGVLMVVALQQALGAGPVGPQVEGRIVIER